MPRRLWTSIAGAAIVALFLVWWLVPRDRPSASERWMAGQMARGAKFTVEEFELARPASVDEFMDRLERANVALGSMRWTTNVETYRYGSGHLDRPKEVGWTRPHLHALSGNVMDWSTAASTADSLADTIVEVHALLEVPQLDPGWDYRVLNNRLNLVAIRELAQTLHALVLIELRRGDLDAAHGHALALIRMGHMHSEAFFLVNQMFRSGISAVATDAVWEMLQANGWTEARLETLQRALEELSFFDSVARSLEVERAVVLTLHPTWGKGLLPWGAPAAQRTPPPDRLRGFFWRRLWAERDLLAYLVCSQSGIDAMERLIDGVPFLDMRPELEAARQQFESRMTGLGGMRYWFSASVTPAYDRALGSLVRNETGRSLAVIAIALERYRLANNRWPADLTELAPTFLDTVPRDLYTGESLRYHLLTDGFYSLYSVGSNGQDNGGIAPDDLVWALPDSPHEGP
jgi:hypothetical protein